MSSQPLATFRQLRLQSEAEQSCVSGVAQPVKFISLDPFDRVTKIQANVVSNCAVTLLELFNKDEACVARICEKNQSLIDDEDQC